MEASEGEGEGRRREELLEELRNGLMQNEIESTTRIRVCAFIEAKIYFFFLFFFAVALWVSSSVVDVILQARIRCHLDHMVVLSRDIHAIDLCVNW